jgi:hypothetical protein
MLTVMVVANHCSFRDIAARGGGAAERAGEGLEGVGLGGSEGPEAVEVADAEGRDLQRARSPGVVDLAHGAVFVEDRRRELDVLEERMGARGVARGRPRGVRGAVAELAGGR